MCSPPMATCAICVPKEGAVDPDHGFAMQYQVLEKNERHVEAISRTLRKSKALYLATDPDREGEAIAWHLKEILSERGELTDKQVHRVVFYEITRNAIREAVAQPRDLSLRSGQCATGAARARLPRGLQSLAAAVEESAAGPVGRTRAEPGAAHDLRARGGDRSLRCRRNTGPSRAKARTRRRPSRSSCSNTAAQKVEQFSFTNETQAREVEQHHRCRRTRPRRDRAPDASGLGELRRRRHRSQAAPPQSGAAVHDLDAAAGSRAQVGFQRAAHHAPRAAAVRRHRYRRRQRRPHHLHAYRLGVARGRSSQRDPRGRRAPVRQGRSGRRAAHLQDQVEECAGSARGHPPDLRGDHACAASKARSTPTCTSCMR